MDNLRAFECYDDLLIEPFNKIGWKAETVSWRKKAVDWDRFDAVIIRSCWDYQQDPDHFLNVLTRINNSSAKLTNSYPLVEWNIAKNYLRDLEQNNLATVPTIWESGFSSANIFNYFAELNTDEIVIKPMIGAGADDTYRLNKNKLKKHLPTLEKVFQDQPFLVQPFLPKIIEEGEYSLFYFNGDFSHAILKKPIQNDFRVQEEHGGTLHLVNPSSEMLNLSEQTLSTLPELPLYARIDLVRNERKFQLMEVELIEPSLYFNMDEKSPCRFVRAFEDWWLKSQ